MRLNDNGQLRCILFTHESHSFLHPVSKLPAAAIIVGGSGVCGGNDDDDDDDDVAHAQQPFTVRDQTKLLLHKGASLNNYKK